jgi:hypothetical protein
VVVALHIVNLSGVDITPVASDSEFYRMPANGAGDGVRLSWDHPATVVRDDVTDHAFGS